MAVINAGELIHRITISFPTTTQNEEGGLENSYGSPVTVFARVSAATSAHRDQAGSSFNLRTKEFAFRWGNYGGIMDQNILIGYEGQEYLVDSIDLLDEGLLRFFKITARAKDNG